jgi:hypothetical protein
VAHYLGSSIDMDLADDVAAILGLANPVSEARC